MASSKKLKTAAEQDSELRARVKRIVRNLAKAYAAAECALIHASPFQLLIATILSAQCTDERVNMVTKVLFAQFPNAPALAAAPIKTVEAIVQSTGFFRAKAKNIVACAQQLVEHHAGEVPQELELLVLLSGVGRKTANVVLNCAFGKPTIAVDTHVFRVSNRMGIAKAKRYAYF